MKSFPLLLFAAFTAVAANEGTDWGESSSLARVRGLRALGLTRDLGKGGKMGSGKSGKMGSASTKGPRGTKGPSGKSGKMGTKGPSGKAGKMGTRE